MSFEDMRRGTLENMSKYQVRFLLSNFWMPCWHWICSTNNETIVSYRQNFQVSWVEENMTVSHALKHCHWAKYTQPYLNSVCLTKIETNSATSPGNPEILTLLIHQAADPCWLSVIHSQQHICVQTPLFHAPRKTTEPDGVGPFFA